MKSGAWHYFSARKPGWRIENQFSIENLVTNKYWDGFKKTIRDTPKKNRFQQGEKLLFRFASVNVFFFFAFNPELQAIDFSRFPLGRCFFLRHNPYPF